MSVLKKRKCWWKVTPPSVARKLIEQGVICLKLQHKYVSAISKDSLVWKLLKSENKYMEQNIHLCYTTFASLAFWFNTPSKATKKVSESPGWCGSVDRVLAWEPKGCQFNSQSGHMLGLGTRSLVGDEWDTVTHWCFSPSLLLCLK